MFRSHFWLSTLLAAALFTLMGGAAIAGPVVFDFEEGLQGWELSGSAHRVQTQLLGGQWSIFGDGRITDESTGLPPDLFISRDIDLTGIASVSVDQFFLAGDERGLVATPMFGGIDLIENIFVGTLGFGAFDASDPFTNPSLRTASMLSFEGMRLEGVHRVEIHWNLQPAVQRVQAEPLAIVAFIDNITFHPVPEPGTFTLIAFGLLALVAIRRREFWLRRFWLLLVGVLPLAAPATHASSITIDFEGSVYSVGGRIAGGPVVIGNAVNGSLTYQTDIVDLEPHPGLGEFRDATSLSFDLSIGSYSAVGINGPRTLILVDDDAKTSSRGTSSVIFRAEPEGAPINGVPPSFMQFGLVSSDTSRLSSGALPNAQELRGFQQDLPLVGLTFLTFGADTGHDRIEIELTSFAVVPEPSTLGLLAFGLSALLISRLWSSRFTTFGTDARARSPAEL